ncbi:MAG: neutral zinc metallopeptidase [Dehalococcoidia bacterium]
MVLRRLLVLITLLAMVSLTVSLVGCGGGDDDDDDPTVAPRDKDDDGIRDTRDDCPTEPEDDGQWGSDPKDGCPGTIEDLIELARSDINAFWEAQFQFEDLVYDPPINFTAYDSEIETACGTAELNNAFYCSADHSIYYDINFLQEQLDSNGDFAPVLIVAHEWGHLVQSLLGILGDEELLTIQTELQADCLAGVWAADADSREMMEEGDFDEGIIALFNVGDARGTPFFDPQAHGSSGQRIDSFTGGFEAGLDACALE